MARRYFSTTMRHALPKLPVLLLAAATAAAAAWPAQAAPRIAVISADTTSELSEFLTDELDDVDLEGSEYIFPDSDSRYLNYDEILDLSLDEINMAINEIYARHGRKFQNKEIQDYFDSLSWYTPKYSPEEFDKIADTQFNDFEKTNVETLAAARKLIQEDEEEDEDSEYIFPDSDSEYLSEEDIRYMSYEELNLAIDEIYARHGREFNNEAVRDYFSTLSWYTPEYSPEEFDKIADSLLNKYEEANIDLLVKAREKAKRNDYIEGDLGESGSSEYIIPDSDSRYLTDEDVMYMDYDELKMAINEIYARHGRKFRKQEIQDYFDSLSWYTPKYSPEEFDQISDQLLNKYESANINVLVKARTEAEQTPVAEGSYGDSGYILEDSDSRYISYDEISGMSYEELNLAIDEIYARRGRKFRNKAIQAYFDSLDWYTPKYAPEDFDAVADLLFNDYEKANISTLASARNRLRDAE